MKSLLRQLLSLPAGGMTQAVRLHPLTLAFPNDLEKQFLVEHEKRSLSQVRLAFLAAIVLYDVFCITDLVLMPEIKNQLWFIRLGLVTPVFLGMTLFTYSRHYSRFHHFTNTAAAVWAGLGVITMHVLAPYDLYYHAYGGLMLCLVFLYTFIGARFIWASLGGWFMVLAYAAAVFWLAETPQALELASLFYVMGANIASKAVCYLIELYNRRDFYLKMMLTAEQERVKAALDEMESYVYTLSHDLRTPIRALDGFSAILQEKHVGSLPEEAYSYITKVRQSARRMGRMVDGLILYARIGQKSIRPREIDPRLAAEAAVASLTGHLEDSRVEIDIHELPLCRADPGLLEIVYRNLLKNSVMFAWDDSATQITVGCVLKNEHVVYYVRDNGRGFNMDYRNKLFGMFQSLHRPEERGETGIDLAIVRRIIERHGGTVWADAVVGEGATFYFTLKKEKDDGSQHTG